MKSLKGPRGLQDFLGVDTYQKLSKMPEERRERLRTHVQRSTKHWLSRWEKDEEAKLKELWLRPFTMDELEQKLGRTYKQITSKAANMNLGPRPLNVMRIIDRRK